MAGAGAKKTATLAASTPGRRRPVYVRPFLTQNEVNALVEHFALVAGDSDAPHAHLADLATAVNELERWRK